MDAQQHVEVITWSCWLRTLFAGSGALLVYVFVSIVDAQSSVLLPQLKGKDSYIRITPDQETWIASLGVLTSPVSGILIGPALDAFGRKKGVQLFYLTMGVGFGIIACATQVHHIYIGRIMCAFGMGMDVVSVVYLAEICTKGQRSFFFAILSAFFSGGLTLTTVVGGYLPWNIASAIFSLACFIVFLLSCLAPESPQWLYKVGKIGASTNSYRRLGRSPAGIAAELDLLHLSSKDEPEKFNFKTLIEPTVWKPFVILVIFHLLQCASGAYDVMFYIVDFIERLGTCYDALTVSIILSIGRFLSQASVGLYFTAVVNRRFATAFSAFLMTVAFVGAGVYVWLLRKTPVRQRSWQWVPVTLVIVNIMAGSMGMTTLPWIIGGEVFPLRARGTMNGAVFVFGNCFISLFIKIYGICMDVLNIWGVLFAFAISTLLAFFFAVFIMPETQNKTMFEVEQSFLTKKKTHTTDLCKR